MARQTGAGQIVNNYGAVIAFGLAVVFFAVAAENFFSWENLQNIVIQSTSLGICALGLTLILMTGELDLSYGGLIGLVGAVLAGLLKSGYSPAVAVLACLALGIISGSLVAFLVVKLGLSSFLASVAVMFLCMGAERVYSHGVTIWIKNESALAIVQGHLGPIPLPIVILAAAFLLCWFLQTQTPLGQYVRALGENIQAVRETGVRARRLKAGVFMAAGAFFALGGALETLRNGGAIVYSGKQLLLFVLAASFLGTASFRAGKANHPGTIIGSLFLVTLMNGFTLMGMQFYLVPLAQGLILLAAVAVTSMRRRKIEQVKF